MSEQEAARSPAFANALDRALGLSAVAVPDTLTVHAAAGDILILCSDGLSHYLEGNQLPGHLTGDPATNASALVALANQAGGCDDISVVSIAVDHDYSQLS